MLKKYLINSRALTKIRSLFLITIITLAVFGGVAGYYLLSNNNHSSESIRIGILADLTGFYGKHIWQGVVLAAEELNARGGLLGKQIEIIGEDRSDGSDVVIVTSALNRLIKYRKVDFVILQNLAGDIGFACQDIISEHKKVTIAVTGNSDEFAQRVLDNYGKYKYFFRYTFNATSISLGMIDSLAFCRDLTGFNKVGYLGEDAGWAKAVASGLNVVLPEDYGFDLVYKGLFPKGTFDFSSYLAAAEAAKTEILLTLITGDEAIPFTKEYSDRQSPMVVFGGIIGEIGTLNGWNVTDGKCNYMSPAATPITVKYPLTSKTVSAQEAYVDRWDMELHMVAARGYDALRFILADAIKRAGTIDADIVVDALEETSIETTQAKNFVFTSSHDPFFGTMLHDPDAEYTIVMCFQWQDEELVPVFPKKIMEEAGATYTYPPWLGPWD